MYSKYNYNKFMGSIKCVSSKFVQLNTNAFNLFYFIF